MTAITELTNVSSNVIQKTADDWKVKKDEDTFDSALNGAIKMLNETNGLWNKVSEQEVRFELGEAINTHDLQIAQEKANVALQYTIAVRDKVLSAYKELMNMQV
ncbi:MAG: flagellar hook-basal body complex protein FliE [Lachnospiraceae bacterium]|nr:flagellar hook-basal body complex protein FliE [Lachnospiraceae bacterium]